MKKNSCSVLVIFFMGILLASPVVGKSRGEVQPENSQVMTMDEFLQGATERDTVFEEILMEGLSLRYQKALRLPPRDLILSVKGEHSVFLQDGRGDPGAALGLSQLFPSWGTEVEASYRTAPSFSSTENSSAIDLTLSQSIAENAFGRGTRWQSQIIGLETEIARHQIVEAYEDYLAALALDYYEWFESYENLQVGRSSYAENLKLLDNIKQRQKSKIAISIDVNKTNLQLLAKRERLIDLEEKYQRATNAVKRAIRFEGKRELLPQEPLMHEDFQVSFERDYGVFEESSRTHEVLRLLEERSSLQVAKDADDLLPSIRLLAGYRAQGRESGLEERDDLIFGGLSVDWPLGNPQERAGLKISEIERDKTKLSTISTRYQLLTDLKDLEILIRKEKKLMDIAQEKIGLAREVLEAETENYSFGKVSLNDYIDAVNVLDNNRFNLIAHRSLHKKFILEWHRLTDRLIDKKDMDHP